MLPLTVITAERLNEWNLSCERLEDYVTDYIQLPYLSNAEIASLVRLLEEHDSLGYLKDATTEERENALARRAGRQLLVALHEATLGKAFADIVEDEFNDLRPDSAQELYLNVCFLNQFDVPVRAGVISRVQDLPFAEFKEKLFRPLEHVVFDAFDPSLHDYVYTARHPHIAEIVVARILRNSSQIHARMVLLLSALNVDYSVDRVALRKLVRGRTLGEQFADYQAVADIFAVARGVAGDDPYVMHQMAIYEMHRPNGNLEKAHEYLVTASRLAEHDRTIDHSFAELAFLRMQRASSEAEKARFRLEARRAARKLTDKPRTPHGYHTLAKIAIEQLREVLTQSDAAERDIDRAVEEAEQSLEDGLQRFPQSEYMLEAEAELSKVIVDEERATKALERAFAANPRSSFIAVRLAKTAIATEDFAKARKVLETALDVNPNEKKLHFNLARVLMALNEDADSVTYHLYHSFTLGDTNFEAQFWYARQLYVLDRIPEAREMFKQLHSAAVPFDLRNSTRGFVAEPNGSQKIFFGRLVSLETTYAFIERDGRGDWVFWHMDDTTDETLWQRLHEGDRVRFCMGFSFRGARAVEVELASS